MGEGGNLQQNASASASQPTASGFEQSLARLKMYKADGIIDEETYKKKAEELFQKHYMDEKWC